MSTAPYRADHVGSLLRPAKVKAARQAHYEDGTMNAADLKRIEDDSIRESVAMQESVGLKAVTDGECRRAFWHYDFIGGLDGFEMVEREEGVQFAGIRLKPIFPTITGTLDFPPEGSAVLESKQETKPE